MQVRARLLPVAAVLVWPAPALACTLCHSAQAASVRDRLLQPDLWVNACALALPLAVLAAIVAGVCLSPDDGRRR